MNLLKHFFRPKGPPTSDENAWALLKAAAKGKLEEVRALLEQGTDINAKDKHYSTALMKAASGSHWEVVRCLLDNGADVNAEDKQHCSALIKAASRCHWAVVSCLLDHGANVNARGEYGETSLMLAAWCNNGLALTNGQLVRSRWESRGVTADAVVRHLISKGADVNVTLGRTMSFLAVNSGVAGDVVRSFAATDGSTALIMAAAQGHFGLVRLLLEAGADATTQVGNFTALGIAQHIYSRTSEAASYNEFERARSGAYQKVISLL